VATDYNSGHTAEYYQEAKTQPWRQLVEDYSFLELVGDVRGQTVLDVACGEGHYTRMLRRSGAAKVVGIDIAQRMIDLAREQEALRPLGITYLVEDACTVVPQRDFDLVVSAWLLVYAQSRAQLTQMCRGLASRVRSGGRFVTVTTNPGVYEFDSAPDYGKYGFEMALSDHAFDGAPIDFTFPLGDAELKINNYYLPLAAYEAAFSQAGFHDFRVHPPQLSPAVDNPRYWDDFMDFPILVLMDCIRD
jgi:toxoflavin synthase